MPSGDAGKPINALIRRVAMRLRRARRAYKRLIPSGWNGHLYDTKNDLAIVRVQVKRVLRNRAFADTQPQAWKSRQFCYCRTYSISLLLGIPVMPEA